MKETCASFPLSIHLLLAVILLLGPFSTFASEDEGVSSNKKTVKINLEKRWEVIEHAKIDAAFRKLPVVHPAKYKKHPFFAAFRNSSHKEKALRPYFAATEQDLDLCLLGHFKLRDFLAFEITGQRAFQGRPPIYFFLLDPQLLHRLLNMGAALYAGGYDPSRIRINSSYRSPWHNDKIKGARQSRHMHGEAIDLQIGDINHDGYANNTDKDIVLDILETRIMKGNGGLGKYPGTQTIHVDTRPWRARWNSYKR